MSSFSRFVIELPTYTTRTDAAINAILKNVSKARHSKDRHLGTRKFRAKDVFGRLTPF